MTRLTTVPFGDDTLFGLQDHDAVYVAVTPICEALGLAPQKQQERIKRDPILSEGATTMVTPSAGGPQESFVLRLDLLHGWLFTIDHSRVREEARPKVLHYKRECYAVLFRHFYGAGEATTAPSEIMPQTTLPEPVRLRMVTEARMVFGSRVAAELWFRLDLPIVPGMTAPSRQGVFVLDQGRAGA